MYTYQITKGGARFQVVTKEQRLMRVLLNAIQDTQVAHVFGFSPEGVSYEVSRIETDSGKGFKPNRFKVRVDYRAGDGYGPNAVRPYFGRFEVHRVKGVDPLVDRVYYSR